MTFDFYIAEDNTNTFQTHWQPLSIEAVYFLELGSVLYIIGFEYFQTIFS